VVQVQVVHRVTVGAVNNLDNQDNNNNNNNNNNNSLFTPRKQLQETTHGALERTKSGNKMHHLHRSLLQSLLNLFVETPQKSNSLQ
jgi:hypothetical protein